MKVPGTIMRRVRSRAIPGLLHFQTVRLRIHRNSIARHQLRLSPRQRAQSIRGPLDEPTLERTRLLRQRIRRRDVPCIHHEHLEPIGQTSILKARPVPTTHNRRAWPYNHQGWTHLFRCSAPMQSSAVQANSLPANRTSPRFLAKLNRNP